jgi:nucleotide-binding universal stress UspA family protein
VEDLKRSRLIRARAFLKAARDAGVKASFRVDESSARPADVILKTAREVRADMVALAAQSSRLRARLLGSVSRDVLRAAQIPVWILHAVR